MIPSETHTKNVRDERLVELVSVVKNQLRDLDIIISYSGKKFIVILPNTTFEIAIEKF